MFLDRRPARIIIAEELMYASMYRRECFKANPRESVEYCKQSARTCLKRARKVAELARMGYVAF